MKNPPEMSEEALISAADCFLTCLVLTNRLYLSPRIAPIGFLQCLTEPNTTSPPILLSAMLRE
jgi:hypothetical protein